MPPLTRAERLDQMPFGGQQRVATKLKKSKQLVSQVMRGEWHPKTAKGRATARQIQAALAAELGRPVEEVFPQIRQEAPRPKARAS